MVVDALHVRYCLKALVQRLQEIRFGHMKGEPPRTQWCFVERIHGQMQHDLLAQGMGLFRKAFGIGGVGQKGVGHGAGEPYGSRTQHLVVSHIIDDDGDRRLFRNHGSTTPQKQ